MNGKFILRARAADGARLYYSAAGPCITRDDAIEFDVYDIETRRDNANEVFGPGLAFEAIELTPVR